MWVGKAYFYNEQVATTSDGEYLLDGYCTKESCLVKTSTGVVVGGYGKIKGYYYTYTKDFYGEEGVYGGRHTCDAIIVTSESEPIIKNSIDWARKLKTDELTNDGRFVLTVEVPDELKGLVTSSTLDNQVELGIINRIEPGRGAVPCRGFVDIISARSI
jgi:hypothetical protein